MTNSKHIVVTGASSGIGFQTAKLLCIQGHTVFAIARNQEKLETLENEVNEESGSLIPIIMDLSSFDKSNFDEAFKSVSKIDILINNAGVLLNKEFLDISEEDILKVFNLNYISVVKTIQYFHSRLCKSNSAHIVNIGSVGGVTNSVKFPGLSIYSSSKGALSILSECLAKDFEQDDISVNCLALGAVNTDMLKQAFPDYQAETEPDQMAGFISNFALKNNTVMNGVTQIVSVSNP